MECKILELSVTNKYHIEFISKTRGFFPEIQTLT